MASEVFLAIFRARFDALYDASNESGLRWWINENIRDFIAPTYLRGNPFNPCTVRREGHRPKVLLWIMEEFFHISHDLTEMDRDGRVVLCYELMIEAERRFRIKRGGGVGRRRPTSTTSNAIPCPPDKLEDVAWNKPDSKTLERMVWSVYDGILSPGPTPKLTGPETYNQVTRRLASKVFRGVQVRCPTRTSAQFDEPSPVRVRSVVFAVPPSGAAKSSQAADAMDTSPRKEDQTLEGAVGGQIEEDPNTHPMAWMRDRQNSYSDGEIHFWPLLRPLTDGGGTNTRRLARRLLSTWQWSAAIETEACPPAPSNMEIGRWLPLDRRGNKEDIWAEAYCGSLQRVAEASVGRSWETEGEGMVPKVSPLVLAFLAATGRSVNPLSARECWPAENDIIPRQPMNPIRAYITECLDKAATRSPSALAWDMFAWPESNKNFWKEDCLTYSAGSTVDLSNRMPGVRLNLRDRDGNNLGVARVLRYEGHMLVYDPHTNGAGWVAMKGVPASLTEVEARSAEELRNFYPAPRETREEPQVTRSPPEEATVSPDPPKAETPRRKTGTVEANVDWDTDDVQDRSRPPSPSAGIGAMKLGESAEDVSPPGQDTRLVTDRVVEPGAVPPKENAPIAGEKLQIDAAAEDQPAEFCEGDVVDLYAGTEEL